MYAYSQYAMNTVKRKRERLIWSAISAVVAFCFVACVVVVPIVVIVKAVGR